MKLLTAAIILYAILAFTACKTVSSVLQEPVVSLHSAEIVKINFSGAQLLCKVQVENPNIFDIPFPEVGWEIFINANSFISGVVRNDQRIKARDTTFVEIPVNLDYLDMLNTFTSLLGRIQIDYKIALAVKFSIPVLGDKVWRYEPAGTVPLPQIPRLSAPVFRVEKADLNMVELFVSVNMENPNTFELPPPRITFNYQINNTSIIQNTIANRSPLAASSVTPVIFGLVVYYNDIFRVLPSLRTLKNVPSTLDMSFNFAVPFFRGETFHLEIPGSLQLP
jgi:LEA14-like dessication related protein